MPSMGQTINYPFIKCTHNMVAEKNCMNNTHKLLAETQQSNDLLPDTDILIQGQDLFHHQMVESNSFQTHQNNRRLFWEKRQPHKRNCTLKIDQGTSMQNILKRQHYQGIDSLRVCNHQKGILTDKRKGILRKVLYRHS
jgi:hypothetical protein